MLFLPRFLKAREGEKRTDPKEGENSVKNKRLARSVRKEEKKMGATTFHYGTLRVTDRGNFLLSLTIPLSKTAIGNTVPRSFRNDNFPHVIESSTCVLHCSRSHAPPSRFSALLQNF